MIRFDVVASPHWTPKLLVKGYHAQSIRPSCRFNLPALSKQYSLSHRAIIIIVQAFLAPYNSIASAFASVVASGSFPTVPLDSPHSQLSGLVSTKNI